MVWEGLGKACDSRTVDGGPSQSRVERLRGARRRAGGSPVRTDGEQGTPCAHAVISIWEGQSLFDVRLIVCRVCVPPPSPPVTLLMGDAGFQKKKERGKFWQ